MGVGYVRWMSGIVHLIQHTGKVREKVIYHFDKPWQNIDLILDDPAVFLCQSSGHELYMRDVARLS